MDSLFGLAKMLTLRAAIRGPAQLRCWSNPR
jgi:hypothetical protein